MFQIKIESRDDFESHGQDRPRAANMAGYHLVFPEKFESVAC